MLGTLTGGRDATNGHVDGFFAGFFNLAGMGVCGNGSGICLLLFFPFVQGFVGGAHLTGYIWQPVCV